MAVCEPVESWFFWFFLVYSVNSIANIVTANTGKIYKCLTRPWFAPPSWVFPVAWFLNFLILATSAFLIWLNGGGWAGSGVTWRLVYFIVHMALLPLWSILFWYYQFRFVSFVWILVILLVAIGNSIAFSLLDLTAGLILIPYIVWLLFALILNFYIWRLNVDKPRSNVVNARNTSAVITNDNDGEITFKFM